MQYMLNSKIVRAIAGTIAAIGFCVCVYGFMRGGMDSQAKIESTGPVIALCGFVVMAAGLAGFLCASRLVRDDGPDAESPLETAKEFVEALLNLELGAAATLFAFYGLLGLFWGYAIDAGG